MGPRTALLLASWSVVEELLGKGASVDLQNKDGEHQLHERGPQFQRNERKGDRPNVLNFV